jgi:uncharacterized protein (TIGR02246 family)
MASISGINGLLLAVAESYNRDTNFQIEQFIIRESHMRRHILAILCLAFFFISARAIADTGLAADKKALDGALEAWVAAFNKHDAKALALEYAEDANLMTPTGEVLKGREAIAKFFSELFSKNPNLQTKLSNVARTVLAPEIVVEDGEWEESGHSEAGSPTKGHYTTILVYRNGKWLAIHERGWSIATEDKTAP